jgi:hypothetical protein
VALLAEHAVAHRDAERGRRRGAGVADQVGVVRRLPLVGEARQAGPSPAACGSAPCARSAACAGRAGGRRPRPERSSFEVEDVAAGRPSARRTPMPEPRWPPVIDTVSRITLRSSAQSVRQDLARQLLQVGGAVDLVEPGGVGEWASKSCSAKGFVRNDARPGPATVPALDRVVRHIFAAGRRPRPAQHCPLPRHAAAARPTSTAMARAAAAVARSPRRKARFQPHQRRPRQLAQRQRVERGDSCRVRPQCPSGRGGRRRSGRRGRAGRRSARAAR